MSQGKIIIPPEEKARQAAEATAAAEAEKPLLHALANNVAILEVTRPEDDSVSKVELVFKQGSGPNTCALTDKDYQEVERSDRQALHQRNQDNLKWLGNRFGSRSWPTLDGDCKVTGQEFQARNSAELGKDSRRLGDMVTALQGLGVEVKVIPVVRTKA